ncbi:MAG: hypothetical protein WC356_04035 [Candidatus Micrarchaeia archaeon]|jgi:hypothetical protein
MDLKGQSTLEALISFTILILIIGIVFSSINTSHTSELNNNKMIEAKMELENIALRSNFISTSTAPYTKTPFVIPAYIGYTGNEITKDIEGKKISSPVLSEIVWAFGDKRYVVNRLDGEPI